jgi:N-acetylneuraminic acid mutarotase
MRLVTAIAAALLVLASARAADPQHDARVASRLAIEQVRHRHRLWPESNPKAKAPLPVESLLPKIAAAIDDDDRKVAALVRVFGIALTAADLQAELDRMARDTRDPERLQEMWTALANDPARIADALARPLLADRRLRERFAADPASAGAARGTIFEAWWSGARGRFPASPTVPVSSLSLPPIAAKSCVPDTWATMTASAPEARAGHTAIWTGTEMIVWGGVEGSHLDTGARYDPAIDTWAPISTVSAPTGRFEHTAVWTGTEMIVYGGQDAAGSVEDGARYNPTLDTWTPVAPFPGAVGQRTGHSAVWTGTEMIVWGGIDEALFAPVTYGNGGRYNPATNAWTVIPPAGAPPARFGHTAVWTGTEMIVWGGVNETNFNFIWTNSGSRYNPVTGGWTRILAANPPSARAGHRAVWTGSKMIVWGGANNGVSVATGGRYDPATNSWAATATSGAPTARINHTAVWTGTRLVIWGGDTPSGAAADGARYDPVADSWGGIATAGAPAARGAHAAVWTGSRMIVFGGRVDGGATFSSGGRYDPVANAWTPTKGSDVERPLAREHHVAVWTGSEMIVWGGERGVDAMTAGAKYEPASDVWIPIATANEPIARTDATAVWTGTEMIVWGGESPSEVPAQLQTGARYDPAADTWTPTSIASAPTGRALHRSVWTGHEMIAWGGVDTSGGYTSSGGRYDPSADTWAATSQTGAPDPRDLQAQSWNGREMIVWGGIGFLCCHVPSSGARYDPASDTWTAMTFTKAPEDRSKAAVAWSGNHLVVWGGINADGGELATGGRYSPFEDAWTVTADPPITARNDFASTWMCGAMWIWGGQDAAGPAAFPKDGALYDPGADVWTASTAEGAPFGRRLHTAAGNGTRAIVWGGRGSFDDSATGALYCGCAVAPPPTAVVGLGAGKTPGGARFRWATSPSANGYDVTRGDLAALLASGGDFALATTGCVGNDLADGQVEDDAVPSPGGGFWYLVRAVNGSGAGTYDGDDGEQAAPRDPGIAASPAGCP